MEGNWLIWIIVFVACLVLEGLSMQLFSIWFALGALVAVLADLLKAPTSLEIVLFLAVTVVTFLATRPLAKRLLATKKQPTNADRYVGKQASVLEEINNTAATGLIKVDGQIWTARTADGSIVPVGELVQTLEIQGSKIMVSHGNP
jgi:membrane protein implicated in regulation of membrane protease activity